MPCMPEILTKAAIFKKIDVIINQRNKRKEIRDALRAGTALTDIALAYAPAPEYKLAASEIDHINNDWFKNWWRDAQALGPGGSGGVEQVVRAAFIEALELGIRTDMDIDCYWECHYQHEHHVAHMEPRGKGGPSYGSDEKETVQASVSWGQEKQLTLLFHTPPPEAPPPDPDKLTVRDPINVIRHESPGTVNVFECRHMPSPTSTAT